MSGGVGKIRKGAKRSSVHDRPGSGLGLSLSMLRVAIWLLCAFSCFFEGVRAKSDQAPWSAAVAAAFLSFPSARNTREKRKAAATAALQNRKEQPRACPLVIPPV